MNPKDKKKMMRKMKDKARAEDNRKLGAKRIEVMELRKVYNAFTIKISV